MSAEPWFIFAFDHRNSFRGMLRRVLGTDDHENAVAAKGLLFDGFCDAVAGGVGPAGAAVLIDEQYGSGFAAPARAIGAKVIVPVERSGQEELQLEYGEDFGAHVEAFAPDAVKALLRWDPDGDAALNARQGRLLAEVSDWMVSREIPLIVEFLTPPLASSTERADCMVRAVEQILRAGARPDLWKVEGLDATEDCRRVADAVAESPRPSQVIVLGRGVSLETAARWLEVAAPVPTFNGFAIGKTLWQEPMEAHLGGDIARADAVAEIAARYRRLVDAWSASRGR